MKNLPDDLLLSEINIPGTHNSTTQFSQYAFFSRCQKTSVTEQLYMGVRFLDFRVEKDGDYLRLVHAWTKCRKTASDKGFLMLDDVLSECRKFLVSNPSETLIISIKCDHGDTSENTFDVFFKSYLKGDLWYTENRVPQLSEVRGKAVFFNRFSVDCKKDFYTDSNAGLNFSEWKDQGKYSGKTHLTSVMAHRAGNGGDTAYIQDWYKLSPKEKWRLAILPLLENPPCEKGIFISFFSCGNLLNNPRKCAKYINRQFLNMELKPLKKYGWLLFDFITEKICRKIIFTNFSTEALLNEKT